MTRILRTFSLLTFLAAQAAQGQSPAEAPPPEARALLEIAVPRDELPKLLGAVSGRRMMKLGELKDLLDREYQKRRADEEKARLEADRAGEQHPRPYVIESASFQVEVLPDQSSAVLRARYEGQVFAEKGVELSLPLEGAGLQRIQIDDKDAGLLEGGSREARVQLAAGRHVLTFVTSHPISMDDYSRTVQLTVIPFTRAAFGAAIPGENLEVVVMPGMGTSQISKDGLTQVTSDLAASGNIQLTWFTLAKHDKPSALPAATDPGDPVAPSAEAVAAAPPFVHAETCHVVEVGASAVSGRLAVRYTVDRSPISRVTLRIPDGVGPVRLDGGADLVATQQQEGGLMRLKLKRPQTGEMMFFLSYRIPREMKPDSQVDLSIPRFKVEEVQGTAGFVVVERVDNLKIEAKENADLVPLDAEPLPPHFQGMASEDPLLAYRDLQPPSKLDLALSYYRDTAVLPAVITRAMVTSLYSMDGDVLTAVSYAIQSRNHDFLRLNLPKDHQIEKIEVDGRRIHPGHDDQGRMLIPLPGSLGSEEKIAQVLVEYRSRVTPLLGSKSLACSLPAADIPTLEVGWQWLVPDEIMLYDLQGRVSRSRPASIYSHVFPDLLAGMQRYESYFSVHGLVHPETTVEVTARPLGPWARLVPMTLFFLMGLVLVGFIIQLVVTGKYPRFTLALLALTYLASRPLWQVEDIFPPLLGGVNLALWGGIFYIFFSVARTMFRWGVRMGERFHDSYTVRPRPRPPEKPMSGPPAPASVLETPIEIEEPAPKGGDVE